MPKPQQNLLTSLVGDPATVQNFNIVNKNFTNIFNRLTGDNYSVSEPCSAFSTSVVYPTLVNPTNLQVSLKTSGKPVIIFLRQKSDASSPGVYTAGGITLSQNTSGIFYITRGDLPIYGTVLGSRGSLSVISGLSYVAPSAIFAFDEAPPVGVQTYFLQAGAYLNTENFATIYGGVEQDGTVSAGLSGSFSVTHTVTSGIYKINFGVSFLDLPSVTVCMKNVGGGVLIPTFGSLTTSSVEITTRAGFSPQILYDLGFSFQITGPIDTSSNAVNFTDVELVAKELI